MAIRNYGLITSIDELNEFIERIRGNVFGFDIETGYLGPDREKGSIHPETAILVGISFTDSTDWARYVPLGHDNAENLDNKLAAAIFWDLLQTGLGVAHNASFELRHLAKWFRQHLSDDPLRGAAVRATAGYYPIRSDTLVEAYLKADFERFGLKLLTALMFDRTGQPVDESRYLARMDRMAEINRIKDPEDRNRQLASFDGHLMTELYELFPGLEVGKRKYLRFNVLDLTPQVIEYACEDSVWCLAIHRKYYPQVNDRSLYTVEMAIVQHVLHSMEDEGIVYDWALMRRTADELRAFRDKFNAEIMAELSEMIGQPVAVNLASPPQIADILYTKLGYQTSVYTDKTRDLPPEQRKMSTGKIALERLAQQYPVVQKIRQWKQITRLLGTYLDQYEKKFNYADDGRAHPSHLSCFVITGRFAASDPPYQGSPKKYHYDLLEAVPYHQAHRDAHGKPDGKKWCECGDREFKPPPGTCFTFNFRDVITAPPGHYILGFDLSQAELRAIAGEAGETALLEAFANGDDVHKLTASLMLGVSFDEITAEQRDIGKTMNFALLYGMSTKGLADRLGIPIEEAQSLMDKYFAGLPNIAAYMSKQVQHGQTNGYVTSKFKRKLPIWEYRSDKRWIYQKGDRACVNYPIQGCLPRDTRVLTRGGWVAIGDFVDGAEVWTGAEWAPAQRLARGEAPRVRLHLSDGRTFDCDDRHKLLVRADPWPEWKNVMDAKGLPLCQDRNTDWGTPDGSSVEDWYWIGRFVGDGALFQNKTGQAVWNMSFNGVKEADDVQRFRAWLDTKPFKTARSKKGYSYDDSALRAGRGKGVKVQGVTAAAIEFWEAHGIRMGAKAKNLRVPGQVFALDHDRRLAFCEGYLDADGNSRHTGRETYWSKLTSASRNGLEDMLKLFQTIGRTGRISAPVVLKGRAKDGADYVFYDLWLHRNVGDLTIVDIEVFEPEPMFTLSVFHPRHSFSSEGLISKNSATGDYMKMAMVLAVNAIRAAGLQDKLKLVMNIHDALEFYVHTDVDPQDAINVLRPAVVFPVSDWPEMRADWHIAKRWGSPTEITFDADGKMIVKGETVDEIAPGLEEDEDGEVVEILPEVDPEVLREAAKPDSGRQVVITLHAMPHQDNWNQFGAMARESPGLNNVRVITPQGEVVLPFTCSIRPDHAVQISLVLGISDISVEYLTDAVEGSRVGV